MILETMTPLDFMEFRSVTLMYTAYSVARSKLLYRACFCYAKNWKTENLTTCLSK